MMKQLLMGMEREFPIKEDIFVDDLLKFLNEFIRFGGYPEVIKSESEEEKLIVLKNIVNT